MLANPLDGDCRDEDNRALGDGREERVLLHERASLGSLERSDLAEQIRRVSEEEGDGYDILSFTPEGAPRLLGVKITNGWAQTPFRISRNDVDCVFHPLVPRAVFVGEPGRHALNYERGEVELSGRPAFICAAGSTLPNQYLRGAWDVCFLSRSDPPAGLKREKRSSNRGD